MTWSNTVVDMSLDSNMFSSTVILGIVVMFAHTRSTDIFLGVVVGARVLLFKVYMTSIYILTTTCQVYIRESSIYNRDCCVRFIGIGCLYFASSIEEYRLACVQLDICGHECSESLQKDWTLSTFLRRPCCFRWCQVLGRVLTELDTFPWTP